MEKALDSRPFLTGTASDHERLIVHEAGFRTIRNPMFRCDTEGIILDANDATERIYLMDDDIGEPAYFIGSPVQNVLSRLGVLGFWSQLREKRQFDPHETQHIGVVQQGTHTKIYKLIGTVVPSALGIYYQMQLIRITNVEALQIGLKNINLGQENALIDFLSRLSIEEDPVDTGPHLLRVKNNTRSLGRAMQESSKWKNLSPEFIESVADRSPLHDIGKAKTPKDILHKPGAHDPVEREIMKRHVIDGYEIIKDLHLGEVANNIVLHHHSRWDGQGYPLPAVFQEAVPLEARIVSLTDVFDAMTSKRCYTQGDPMSVMEALVKIQEMSGKNFDPLLVEIFLRTITENPKSIVTQKDAA